MRRVHAWLTEVSACFDYRIRLPFAYLPDDFVTSWGGPPEWPVDVVVGQRLTGDCPGWLALCADPNVLAVLDMDDDLTSIDPENTVPYSIYAPVAEQTRELIRASDAVTVCTEHAADVLSRLNPRTFLLPVCGDPALLDKRTENENERLELGWAGSIFHGQDWGTLGMALLEVARLEPELGFVSIGSDFTRGTFEGRRRIIGHQTWPGYFDAISDIDIGLAPLLRSEWNQGKSWTKPLEYAMRGVPVIAENWGQYPAWVKDGYNGLLVHTGNEPGEWVQQILALVGDESLRAAMAEAAFETAVAHTIDKHIDKWTAVYSQ